MRRIWIYLLVVISLFNFPVNIYANELPVIGANLAAYQPPIGAECDINVPLQYVTIQEGIDAAIPGNTICVGPGTYNEDISINKTVRISGSGVDKSIIKGQNPYYRGVFFLTGTTGVTIEGFSILGAGLKPTILLSDGNGNTTGATIRYNYIMPGTSGVPILGHSTQSNLIQNNVIAGNSSATRYGFVTLDNSVNNRILNNTFIGTGSGYSIYVYAPNSLIAQNTFDTLGGTRDTLIRAENNVINENNFNDERAGAVYLSGSGNNIDNNWWGVSSPPSGVVSATSPFPEYPFNQKPIIRSITDLKIVNGDTYTSSSYFLDYGSLSWTATVDYGDGSGILPLTLSFKNFSLSHVYQTPGTYTVKVAVTDDQNAISTTQAVVIVSNTEPIVGANLNAYVPPTDGECDIYVPAQYTTVQAAVNAASVGKTICVGFGIYNEDIIIDKQIRLSGSGFSKSFINGSSSLNNPTIFIAPEGNDTIIEGFFIKRANGNSPAISISEYRNRVSIRNNWITAGDGGYALWGNGIDNLLIQNNIMEGNNSPCIIGIPSSNRVDTLNNTFLGTMSLSDGCYGAGSVVLQGSPYGSINQNAFNVSGNFLSLIKTKITVTVNQNNFNSGSIELVGDVSSRIIINAEHNWWGDIDPSDNVVGDVDYSPFATSPFSEYQLPVLNQQPVANAGLDQTVFVGDLVDFDGSASSDPDGNQDIVSYNWDFGDGYVGSGITTSYAYFNTGSYTVTLTVTDTAGESSADTLIVIIQTPAQATLSLIDLTQTFNLQQGIENSIDAKLEAAVDSLNDLNQNNDASAINSLQAFINSVEAQRGNKISNEQADELIASAQAIINHLSI